ncbi:MAG: glycosyl hydrolase family 31 [Chloroflexi bacterium]|nr:glycosyl hydrolase family 31 [Chloroflexota bacterium]
MKTIEAQVVDHNHLRLLQPIQLPRLSKVMIAVLPSEGNERAAWLRASADWLNSAYGDNEPEYSPAMIKENNPGYDR